MTDQKSQPHPDRDAQHGWCLSSYNITTAENIAAIRAAVEQAPIIVEHWLYCRGSAPERRIFEEFEEFDEYLRGSAQPGDAFYVWSFKECRDDNTVAQGKFPDSRSFVPRRGAY